MQSSTNRKPSPKHILLLGPPGGGKTTFALSFPSPYIIDCDQNLDGPQLCLTKRNKDFTYHYDTPAEETIPMHERWEKVMGFLRDAIKSPDVKTIIIDSLTHLDEYLLRHVMNKQGQKEMRIQDWIPFRSELAKLIMLSRSSSKTVILTAHEQKSTNKEGHVIKLDPAIRSRISDFFGSFFTDIYRCYSTIIGGKEKFYLQTFGDGISDLKNSLGAPALFEETKEKTLYQQYNEYAKLI